MGGFTNLYGRAETVDLIRSAANGELVTALAEERKLEM